MLDLESKVGQKSKILEEVVSEEDLRNFCEAIGLDYNGSAPPTYITVFRSSEFSLFDELDIPLSNVLHAEQEYKYHKKITPGMLMSFFTVLEKYVVKKGGTTRLHFLTFQSYFNGKQKDELLATSKTTVVVREKVDSGDSND